jgi:hypothetical protein
VTLLLAEKVRQFTCYWRTIHVMLGLQSRDHAKKRKENTSWSQATFVYFRAMPPRHLTPALVACRCRPPPLRVVAPSADYEYLMFLGARRSCGQFKLLLSPYFPNNIHSHGKFQRHPCQTPPIGVCSETVSVFQLLLPSARQEEEI